MLPRGNIYIMDEAESDDWHKRYGDTHTQRDRENSHHPSQRAHLQSPKMHEVSQRATINRRKFKGAKIRYLIKYKIWIINY